MVMNLYILQFYLHCATIFFRISIKFQNATLSYNGSGSVSEYNSLLQSLTISFNSSEFSCPPQRTINVQVFDGM